MKDIIGSVYSYRLQTTQKIWNFLISLDFLVNLKEKLVEFDKR